MSVWRVVLSAVLIDSLLPVMALTNNTPRISFAELIAAPVFATAYPMLVIFALAPPFEVAV